MLARSKLNSIESKISEALINSEISHEDFIRELKESVRMMNSQWSDTEKVNLIGQGKENEIDEVIKQNEIINKSLKYKI